MPDADYEREVVETMDEIRASRTAGHGDRYPDLRNHEPDECTVCDAFRRLDAEDEPDA